MAFDLCSVVLFYLFLNQLSYFVSSLKHIPPQILSEYETIIESGDNYTVLCQGSAPLKWQSPKIMDASKKYESWTTVTTADVLPVNGSYKYASRLFIQNATFPFTGFYTCSGDGVHASDSSSIYLYVRDEDHLSVTTDDVASVIVTQYSEAVLPCRPTSPDVDVQLTLISGEKKDSAIYDPKTGFRFNVSRLSDEDGYCCTFLRGSSESDTCIYLKILPMSLEIPKPILEEISGGHTIVGGRLTLECKVRTQTFVEIKWTTPSGAPDLKRVNISDQRKSPDQSLTMQKLTINETTLEDKGVYFCNVSDNQNHSSISYVFVTIYDEGEHFINLTEENDVYTISIMAGAEVVIWRIDVRGHPQPKLFWLNNNNETISDLRKDKYEVELSDTAALLKIKDITITDFGNYTLVAQNEFETKSLLLFLNVTDKPSVHLEIDDFHMVNEQGTVKCVVAAYPPPTIFWSFKPCLDNSCMFEPLNQSLSLTKGLQVSSFVNIHSLNTGYVKCLARNTIGEDEMVQAYYVTDVKNGFDIFGFDRAANVNDSHIEVALGETIKVICGASVYNYSSNIIWTHDDVPIKSYERYRIDTSRTEYTNRNTLNMESVNYTDAGEYSCQVKSKTKEVIFKNFTLVVSSPSKPVIVKTNLKDLEIWLPNRVLLWCKVKGIPKPVITWYKNDVVIYPSNLTHFGNNNQDLKILSLDYKDEGTYKCVASNSAGSASKQMNLTINNKPVIQKAFIWIVAAMGLVSVAMCFCMGRKMCNERKLRRELQIAGLANFEKGAIESLNPDLGIDDQAELLPYDKKWEFPIEKLKLGKQLGSGAFGVVMKGVAKGIIEGEESTTVAVKMVKKNADNVYIKALASELKIMVHLGKHLNVVNLLGACTKNVTKKELLVIVEYCRFGNIQNYLLRHRENFIDQVDPKTGHIDYLIGQDIIERTYSVSSNKSISQSPYMKYAALSFSDVDAPQIPHMVDYRGDNYNGTTAKTDITTVSMSPNSDEEVILSNNSSVQPEWRSNYRGDYTDKIKAICTKDLLAWAFQVSRGMEYLASRKVLHGDVAARNILLADNNIVKICDFGLAKSMYKSDNYKKKGDGPLPVKWMAIESIRDKVFSTQSDVWSFGIVLWEFFSLAKTPYPGMEADERLYNKLLDGYRMESPEYAPKEIYKMMCDCWHAKPGSRPTFSKLSERIGSLLEDTVRKHYIDLNDPYLVMNTQRLEGGHSDYLAMLSPPDFENLSSPHNYMNDPPQNDTPGYLPMNSAHIFSPRPEDDRIFNFNVNNSKIRRDKERQGREGGVEMVPMLGGNNESDCESSTCNTPAINSISNPIYHLPPIIEKDALKSGNDLVRSADNYVNMPQSKSVLKSGYPMNSKNMNEVHYVNSNSRDWESVKL